MDLFLDAVFSITYFFALGCLGKDEFYSSTLIFLG